jgi:DNA repair exonuclease SbcCD ATPase subunit
MDSLHRLTVAAASPWLWLFKCWRIRPDAKQVAAALQASPTQIQVASLLARNSELEAALEKAGEAANASARQAQAAQERYESEYAALKAKYDRRLRATETEQVQAVKTELLAERDAKHLVELEVKSLKQRLSEVEAQHNRAHTGNVVLLEFIHRRHRLNVPFKPGTARGVLQQAEQKTV